MTVGERANIPPRLLRRSCRGRSPERRFSPSRRLSRFQLPVRSHGDGDRRNTPGEVLLDCGDSDRLETIRSHADRLEQLSEEALTGFIRIRNRVAEQRAALAQPDHKRRLRDGTAWLGGTA